MSSQELVKTFTTTVKKGDVAEANAQLDSCVLKLRADRIVSTHDYPYGKEITDGSPCISRVVVYHCAHRDGSQCAEDSGRDRIAETCVDPNTPGVI